MAFKTPWNRKKRPEAGLGEVAQFGGFEFGIARRLSAPGVPLTIIFVCAQFA